MISQLQLGAALHHYHPVVFFPFQPSTLPINVLDREARQPLLRISNHVVILDESAAQPSTHVLPHYFVTQGLTEIQWWSLDQKPQPNAAVCRCTP